MNGFRHLTDEEVAHMEAELAKHYGEPVRPVSVYCDAFRDWQKALEGKVMREGRKQMTQYDSGLIKAYDAITDRSLQLAIMKSSLLGRMIYGGEKLRTKMCPEHKGVWSGLELPAFSQCPHGCQLTGWLPE